MKTIEIETLADQVRELFSQTARGRVLLTRCGKPFALVTDATQFDAEDVGYITNPEFWKMIAARRREPTVSSAHVKAKLVAAERVEKKERAKVLRRRAS